MKKRMNYNELYSLYDSLRHMGEVSNIDAAYAIAITMRNIADEVDFFEKQRIRIIKKYGTIDGNNFNIDEDKVSEFNQEMTELLSKEVEVNISQANVGVMAFKAEGVRAKDYTVAIQYLIKEKKNESEDGD